MNNDTPHPAEPVLSGTIFDFTPVPLERHRSYGWSAPVQRRFIYALPVEGGPDMNPARAALRDEPVSRGPA